MSNDTEVQPTAWEIAKSDMTELKQDFTRFGAASVVCLSRSASLTVRTTVVTIETTNVVLGLALEVMPRSYQETQDDIMSMFAPSTYGSERVNRQQA